LPNIKVGSVSLLIKNVDTMPIYNVSWEAWSDIEAESEHEAIEKAKRQVADSKHSFNANEIVDDEGKP